MESTNNITRQRVMEELVAIGFANAADFLCLQEGQAVLRSPVDPVAGAAIANLETTAKGVKVKFYDKLKALELLGKQLGMFAGSTPVTQQNNLLDAILAASGGEVDLHAIPELQLPPADGDDLVEQTQDPQL